MSKQPKYHLFKKASHVDENLFKRFSIHSREQQRAQKVFKAQQPLDIPSAKNKLLGFGVQLLDGIDPNPDNMVCAGIIHTQGQQVGCLLRLEPNRQAQVRFIHISRHYKDQLKID